jgi:regulatory protein
VAELRRRLARAGIEAPAAERALQVVCEQGYVDDARYAERFAEDRRNLDGWGNERIRERLEAAGVERQLIDRALAVRDPADELDAAVALLRSRLPEPPRDDRARNRALGLLVRRGYDAELAYEAVRRAAREAA